MIVRHLGHIDFDVIMKCFLSAFDNYYVKMPTDHGFYRQRWKASGVRLDLSYGMFHKDVLVGFIINAIDDRQGTQTAYNAGTGVIPEFRGRRIVKAICEYAILDFIKNGITKCQLEVITKNSKAIKSYEGIGFKTCKSYKCFNGAISAETEHDFKLKKVSFEDVIWDILPNQAYYSWDNQSKSLAQGDYKYYQIFGNNGIQSFFVINPKTGYLAQFDAIEDSTTV